MQNSDWQLFIDDYIIARSTGFDKVLHKPRSLGIVVPADKPWETNGIRPHHVGRKPDGSFFMFYDAMWWDIDRAADYKSEGMKKDRAHHYVHRIAYAISDDGIHWHKPNLGLVDSPWGVDWDKYAPYPSAKGETKENNLGVPFVIVSDLGQYGNMSDPERRYALRLAPDRSGPPAGIGDHYWNEPHGYFAQEIPDFLDDPKWEDKLIDSGGCFNPRRHLLHYWDAINEEWVSLDQGVWPKWLPSRDIARFASKDLVNWTSMSVLYPDAYDIHDHQCYDEPMWMMPFCAEGVVFGLLSWFHSDRINLDGGPILQATPEHPHVWPWARKGICDMRITISRDGGKTWDRTASREAWIPHGTEHDSYDRIILDMHPPVKVGDEDWFYGYVADGDHLNTRNNPDQDPYYHNRLPIQQIALYIQKHNRYISMHARNNSEVLITKPVEVTGEKLQLNVDADRGIVKVGIAPGGLVPTFDGKVPSIAPHLLDKHFLPGFGFDDCEPVYANSVEHTVRFKGGESLGALRGKPVYLLFKMADADLYGFRFS